MLSRKLYQAMHDVIRNSYQTMYNFIRDIKPNDAYYYQRNQAKQCIALSGNSDQTMHNVIREIKPNDA